ncbi:hypothetical protein [Nostoc sp.]|uniref:hypothetical protein n=1 Tax=Nostoc sp. TaxID=1180 RepID=UPI0035942A5D
MEDGTFVLWFSIFMMWFTIFTSQSQFQQQQQADLLLQQQQQQQADLLLQQQQQY